MICRFHRYDSKRRGTRCADCGVVIETKLLDVSTIAVRVGWKTWQVRRVLVAAGLADKIGKKWYTTRARLLSIYPEMAAFL